MSIQWIGIITAITTFTGVWIGHVAVRKIEYVTSNLWLPSLVAILAGLILEFLSLISKHHMLSASLGIFAVTLLWDGIEFWRQQRRVWKGHAPANPSNPRHLRILSESSLATTFDLLDRDPVGYPVNQEDAIDLVKGIES